MSARTIGPQDDCVQCGEKKDVIRAAQRRGGLHTLFCAIVDYWGETEVDWDRHRFIWTQADADAEDREAAHWEVVAFNAQHSIGTPVLAYPGFRPDDPLAASLNPRTLTTRTRSAAWLLGDHTPVVLVDDHAGGIALTHIDVITDADGVTP